MKIELREGDLMMYEPAMHLAYFIRGTELLEKKKDMGREPQTLNEIQRYADSQGKTLELRAVLTKETENFWIFTFKSLH